MVDDKNNHYQESLPDILFMCVEKPKLLQLCELFPQTAENIKDRAKERRVRFMQQKNLRSKRYQEKKQDLRSQYPYEKSDEEREDYKAYKKELDKKVTEFYSDEEPENESS